ncbi:acidic amino acid decarboxylase GADL1-like isoform 2-T2 [Spinachia spinachia]
MRVSCCVYYTNVGTANGVAFVVSGHQRTGSLRFFLPLKSGFLRDRLRSLVKEKQLMQVASSIGKSWKEIGLLALDVPAVEHIEVSFPPLQKLNHPNLSQHSTPGDKMANMFPDSFEGQESRILRDLSEPLVNHKEGQLFLNDAFKIIMEEVLCKEADVKQKVCEWKEPEELSGLLDLELRETGEPQERLLQRVKDVAKYSIKTGHPRFFNQLFAGVDYHALAGRFLTEALNTNLYTYEVAPVFVLMENEILRGMRQLVGWTDGDGIFCPGGSISNMQLS